MALVQFFQFGLVPRPANFIALRAGAAISDGQLASALRGRVGSAAMDRVGVMQTDITRLHAQLDFRKFPSVHGGDERLTESHYAGRPMWQQTQFVRTLLHNQGAVAGSRLVNGD